MTRLFGLAVLALLLLAPSSTSAQLLAAKDGPIVYGHHHLSAANVDAAKKFWTETLGGTLARIGTGNTEVVKIPNALIFFAARPATGGSKGTTFDHIGLSVPNLRAVLDKVKAAGFKVVTAAEAPPNVKVVDDIGVVDAGGVTGIGYVHRSRRGEAGAARMKAQKEPIANHHLHFFGEKQAEMQAWYVKTFGGAEPPGAESDDDERRPARPRHELLAVGRPGRRHARPRRGSHRLRGQEPRGVHEEPRGRGASRSIGRTPRSTRSASPSPSSPIRGAPTSS